MTFLDPNACRFRRIEDLPDYLEVWGGECGLRWAKETDDEERPKGPCPRCGLPIIFEKEKSREKKET